MTNLADLSAEATENPLRESPCYLAALDDAPILMWLSQADYNGTYFNRAWLEFTGRSMAEELNGGWQSAVHPDDRPRIHDYNDALLNGTPFQTQYRLRRHDGTWRWMLDNGRPRHRADGSFAGFVGACTDITERVAAEEARRQSEERLQLAQEGAMVGTFDWDIRAGTLIMSAQMFTLYGLAPGLEGDALQSAWRARVHPDDIARFDAEIATLLDTADRTHLEFRILHPETGERFIQSNGQIHRDTDGKPLRMVGINFDITATRQTEQALRESEQRIRDIAENFPGIIFRRVSYPDGRIEYPYFSREGNIFHVCRNLFAGTKMLGEPSPHIHYEDQVEMVRQFHHAAETLSPLELEARVINKAGETRWIRTISRPRPRDDGGLDWDGVMLDVTERHHRQAEQRRATAMLQMSMQLAGIGTWEYDPETEHVTSSELVDRLFGIARAEAQSRHIQEYLAAVHPDDRDELRRGVVEGGRHHGCSSREYRVIGPGGITRWITSQVSHVRLADGSDRMVGALFDITDRHRHDEEREAALHHQETLLRELNHRVKNNLQLILSMLRLQRTRVPAAAAALESAINRVEAMSDLHAQLAFVSGAGKIDFKIHLEELSDKLRRSVLAESKVTLVCDAQSCVLDLDRAVPLGLMVNELVTNAIKYAFPENSAGTIRIGLTCTAKSDKNGKKHSLTLSVSDDGIGLRVPGPDRGLGSRLVEGLGLQIGATISQVQGTGTSWQIDLPEAFKDT